MKGGWCTFFGANKFCTQNPGEIKTSTNGEQKKSSSLRSPTNTDDDDPTISYYDLFGIDDPAMPSILTLNLS